MNSAVLNSDFSERQVEVDVSAYLTWCAHGTPFRLLGVDEQATGADWRVSGVIPIYVQFKRSTGLTPLPASFNWRKNASPIHSIRAFRRARHLPDNPTLYFQLRAQAKTAVDLQHNILLEHHAPPRSFAVYVAPLHLSHAAYTADLFAGARDLVVPWSWRPTEILSAAGADWWLSRFEAQPFLRSHVSIAPHERVRDHHHYYAYSTGGSHVSWHSPEVLDEEPRRLSDFMSARLRSLLAGDGPTPVEVALRHAEALAPRYGYPDLELEGENALDQLLAYGRWLRRTHDIHQFLLSKAE